MAVPASRNVSRPSWVVVPSSERPASCNSSETLKASPSLVAKTPGVSQPLPCLPCLPRLPCLPCLAIVSASAAKETGAVLPTFLRRSLEGIKRVTESGKCSSTSSSMDTLASSLVDRNGQLSSMQSICSRRSCPLHASGPLTVSITLITNADSWSSQV
eukprot:CAMPEP_0170604386 /NCGR_PEP_ID=MMETSP0224-20130122/19394_1 /TAXON_ID=285029 /ORGANISM="Togula jolla, Strain CCCM 725" /LENGTH=157 /DNA_ID=CAMNT_0010929283 /DNA_START=489 /DNA_END=962 /DNA_ORIENTATION=+